jgi:hypothetical protein
MPETKKFQFSLKHLFIGIAILCALTYGIVYLYEPHLIEDGRYQITVDYSRTLEAMIAAEKYDYVNSSINSTNFPIDQSKSGTETLEAVIVHLDQYVEDTETVLKLMDKKGLRPATLPELLALGEKYQELQRKYLIYALGSRWLDVDGDWNVPYLGGWRGERRLSLDWGDGWGGDFRVLAFRKPR